MPIGDPIASDLIIDQWCSITDVAARAHQCRRHKPGPKFCYRVQMSTVEERKLTVLGI